MQVTSTKDQPEKGCTILIYGDSGVGKTTLLGTLEPSETLIIDIEGGTAVLKDKDIALIRIESDLSNLKEIIDELADTDTPYKNVCLDSITELERCMLVNLGLAGKNNGIPALGDYLAVQYGLREILRTLRDLREKGKNVIINALEVPLELQQMDGCIQTRLYPAISKRIAPEICGLYDVVGRVVVSTKDGHAGQRFILLDPTDQYVAKNRINNKRFCAADLNEIINS